MECINVTRDSATIKWQAPSSDGGTPITSYIIERRESDMRVWYYCGRTDITTTVYTCAGLYENTEFKFRVFAENKAGRSEPLESNIPIVPKRSFGKSNHILCLVNLIRKVSLYKL